MSLELELVRAYRRYLEHLAGKHNQKSHGNKYGTIDAVKANVQRLGRDKEALKRMAARVRSDKDFLKSAKYQAHRKRVDNPRTLADAIDSGRSFRGNLEGKRVEVNSEALGSYGVYAIKSGYQLNSPYHPDIPKIAKSLGGKWNGSSWVFGSDVDVNELIKQLPAIPRRGSERSDILRLDPIVSRHIKKTPIAKTKVPPGFRDKMGRVAIAPYMPRQQKH